MTNEYFSYDPEDGIEFHPTQQAAEDRANEILQAHRDVASEGWDEDLVKSICWGKIAGVVKETKRYSAPEGSGFDEFLEFNLVLIQEQAKVD